MVPGGPERNREPDVRSSDSIQNVGTIAMGFLWTIIIGFLAGVVAKVIMGGSNEPSSFVLTTILGVVGAFLATFLGQALGWYRGDEGAGFIGAVVGAVIILAIWGWMSARRSRTF